MAKCESCGTEKGIIETILKIDGRNLWFCSYNCYEKWNKKLIEPHPFDKEARKV